MNVNIDRKKGWYYGRMDKIWFSITFGDTSSLGRYLENLSLL